MKNINDCFQDIVDIDLKGFFDEVQHYKLLQLIYNREKYPVTLWLIRKWLRAPIQINGRLHKSRKGMPQGGPLSPLLSNILLDKLVENSGDVDPRNYGINYPGGQYHNYDHADPP